MRISFFCHSSEKESWSCHSLATGIGGSEEAVIHMATALAARGHDVTIVNAGVGPCRRINNVTWTSCEALAAEPADVGIVWRRPWRLDAVRDAARRFYLWLHDCHPEADVLTRLDAFAKIMVLSRFHRLRYPSIGSERIWITANGIDAAAFTHAAARQPTLIVYGSCYSRGLCTLLRNWRAIRAAVPQARLNIFYGWQTIQKNNPERYQRLRSVIEPLLQQHGIRHLGRIGHDEVARQYACAGVWAYPCSFPETSCISAMKAQAGGAVPAVIATGALGETVHFGFKTMRGHTDFAGLPAPRRIVDEWLEGVIELLRAPELQSRIRRDMIPDSRRRFAWSRVVDGWEQEFQAA